MAARSGSRLANGSAMAKRFGRPARSAPGPDRRLALARYRPGQDMRSIIAALRQHRTEFDTRRPGSGQRRRSVLSAILVEPLLRAPLRDVEDLLTNSAPSGRAGHRLPQRGLSPGCPKARRHSDRRRHPAPRSAAQPETVPRDASSQPRPYSRGARLRAPRRLPQRDPAPPLFTRPAGHAEDKVSRVDGAPRLALDKRLPKGVR